MQLSRSSPESEKPVNQISQPLLFANLWMFSLSCYPSSRNSFAFSPGLSQKSLGCSMMRRLALVSARAEPTISPAELRSVIVRSSCRRWLWGMRLGLCLYFNFHNNGLCCLMYLYHVTDSARAHYVSRDENS